MAKEKTPVEVVETEVVEEVKEVVEETPKATKASLAELEVEAAKLDKITTDGKAKKQGEKFVRTFMGIKVVTNY